MSTTPTIDPTDAPEGMIAVAPTSRGLCHGCYFYEVVYRTTGACPLEGDETLTCQPENRKDGQAVLFKEKQTHTCQHCAALTKQLKDLKAKLLAYTEELEQWI